MREFFVFSSFLICSVALLHGVRPDIYKKNQRSSLRDFVSKHKDDKNIIALIKQNIKNFEDLDYYQSKSLSIALPNNMNL